MIERPCPDEEVLARFQDGSLEASERDLVLDHAADCTLCRRELVISGLPDLGPVPAQLLRRLPARTWGAAAAAALFGLTLWAAWSRRPEPPGAAPVSRTHPAAPSQPDREPRPSADVPLPPAHDPRPRPAPEVSPVAPLPAPPAVVRAPAAPAPAPSPEAPPAVKPEGAASSPVARPEAGTARDDEAKRATRAKPEKDEKLGRIAILDPFGGLALEAGEGRAVPIQNASVISPEMRLVAASHPGGFRLGDGTRLQLSAGSKMSLYRHEGRRCTGLSLHQGAVLFETPQGRSVYLRRGSQGGIIQGLAGSMHVSAGAKANELDLSPVTGAISWHADDRAPVAVEAGHTLNVGGDGPPVARPNPRLKSWLSHFASWPEQNATLLFARFDSDLEAGDRPGVIQGSVKEGYVSSVAADQKRVIEFDLPAPAAAKSILRLRFRTVGTRLHVSTGPLGPGRGFGGAGGAPGGTVYAVPVKDRSETGWTTASITLASPPFERGGAGRMGRGRSTLTLVVEPPPKVAAEDLVFDVEEIELTRAP